MNFINTDKASSVAAAVQTGKLPSQKQTNELIDTVQQFLRKADSQAASVAEQTGDSDVGKLSGYGSTLARDICEILEAYKQIGTQKNNDDIVQEGLWALAQSETKVDVQSNIQTPEAVGSRGEAKTDAQAVSDALRTLFDVFVGNLGSETSPILAELLSFFRLSIADVAEDVESAARQTKEKLRDVDSEVQEGHRDALGRTKPDTDAAEGQQESGEVNETKAKFEERMDTAKGIGLTAIDVGQQTKQTAQDYSEISRDKVLDAFDNIIRRAQDDPNYGESISTICNIVDKWLNKSLDYADQTSEAGKQSSLDGIVDDPTGQLQQSLRHFNTFIERCAGGKSTEGIKSTFNTFGQDVRGNSEVRQLLSDANDFLRKSLQDEAFVRSDAFDKEKDDLTQRWRSVLNAETPESRKLKEDAQKLQHELEDFQAALKEDKDLRRLAAAYQQFGKDTAKAAAEGTKISQTTIPWMWQDVLNVYLPLALEYMKGIPIPRTEYKDADIEFVVEDLSLDSVRLLPGHAHISTTLNVDIDKQSGASEAVTDLSTRSLIHLKGLSLTALKGVSFWYHDPSLKLASQLTGLMDIAIPPRGVEAQVIFSLLPTRSGSARRQRGGRFHEIRDVQVKLPAETAINLSQTNHQFVASAFKPMVKKRIISQIENILAEQIRLVLETADGIAYDVYRRAGVFADAGLTATGPKYAAAIMSELGELKKHPGLLSGWSLTSVGVVKDDPRTDKVFAVGAAPQVIPGDKHGPRTGTSSINNAINEATGQVQQAVQGAQGQSYQGGVSSAKGMAQDAKSAVADKTKGAQAKVKSFKDTVDAKAAEEKKHEGWRSSAYDVEA